MQVRRYLVELELQLDLDDDGWCTHQVFVDAYTAEDAITQVNLEWKHNDQIIRGKPVTQAFAKKVTPAPP